MKLSKPAILTLSLGGAALAILSPLRSPAQTPNDLIDPKTLTPLIVEIQTQQKTIADNQGKIDAQIAVIAESVRQARIYVSRGGR